MEEKKKVSVMVDGSKADDKPFDFSEFQDEFYEESSGSYQTRKTSIVSGMSTNKLIDEHRRSIANLNEDAGCRVDVDALTGVTLSRRHTLSQQEYNDGLETGTFEELRGYEFKEEG